MGDVDRGGADAVVQAAQLLAHQLAEGGVERAQRLVHQERLGPADDGAAQRHALAVAAGKAAHRPVEQFVDAQELRRLLDPRRISARGTPWAQREADVSAHVHVRVEREQLEHEGDVALAGAPEGDVLAIQPDPARGRQLQARDHAQRRGLAAARRTEQHEEARRPRW